MHKLIFYEQAKHNYNLRLHARCDKQHCTIKKATVIAIQDSSRAPYYVFQKVCGKGVPYSEIVKHKHHEAAVFRSGDDYKLTYYQIEKTRSGIMQPATVATI